MVFLAAILLVPLGATIAPATDKPGPCALDRTPDETTRHWIKRVIRCADDRWPVRGGAPKAICIAKAESGLNPKAESADGTYVGLYQHLADAWPRRYRTWTRRVWQLDDRWGNGRTNTIVTIRMVHSNGWGPWKDVGDC